jgi:excisionase family DNA binding protein
MTDKMSDLLTLKETAEMLRCSDLTVRRMVKRGRLPALRLGGPTGPFRIRRYDALTVLKAV